MFQTKGLEKIETHTSHSVNFFEYPAVYEKMWKNIEEPDSHR